MICMMCAVTDARYAINGVDPETGNWLEEYEIILCEDCMSYVADRCYVIRTLKRRNPFV